MRSQPKILSSYGGPLMADVRFHREWLGQQKVLVTRHLPRLREGGIVGMTVHVDSVDELVALVAEVEESEGAFHLCRCCSEVDAAVARGSVALVLAPSYALAQSNPSILHLTKYLGAMMFPMSMNMRNLLTDGCGEITESGLTALGRSVVERLVELGIVVDLSHISDQGFWDVLELVKGPVVASHSNARALAPNKRNLSDEQAKAIAEKGGTVGVSVHASLLRTGPSASIDDYIAHLTYFVDLIGAHHVTLGTDFIDYIADMVMPKLRVSNPDGSIYHDDYVSTVGLENYAAMADVVARMRAAGLDEEQVEAISYGNFGRVIDSGCGRAGS